MLTLNELKQLNIDEIIKALLENISPKTLDIITHDAILIENFFPTLGEHFQTGPFFSHDELNNFKQHFNYENLGLPIETKDDIEDINNIDRIFDIFVRNMSEDKKKQVSANHIKNTWFVQNAKSNIQNFIDSLNIQFWNLS